MRKNNSVYMHNLCIYVKYIHIYTFAHEKHEQWCTNEIKKMTIKTLKYERKKALDFIEMDFKNKNKLNFIVPTSIIILHCFISPNEAISTPPL